MKYPPQELQKQSDSSLVQHYYTQTEFNPNYQIANVTMRSINFEEDIYKDQIIIGDGLLYSDEQSAQGHALSKLFEIYDPQGKLIFHGFQTNPKEKCLKDIFNSQILHKSLNLNAICHQYL